MNNQQANRKTTINQIIDEFLINPENKTDSLIAHIKGIKNLDEITNFNEKIGEIINKMDSSILLSKLAEKECPAILGEIISTHGTEDQNLTYLFGKNWSSNVDIELVNSRPNAIKKNIIQKPRTTAAYLLLEYDFDTYMAWANDLGFREKLSERNISNLRSAFEKWADEKLIEKMEETKLEMEESEEISYDNTYHCMINECLSQMGYDLYNNGWSNEYGGLSEDIKEILFNDDFGLKSEILKTSVDIDCLIINENTPETFMNYMIDEEKALNRLSYVSAYWCNKNKKLTFDE